jgi:hypothetical protein
MFIIIIIGGDFKMCYIPRGLGKIMDDRRCHREQQVIQFLSFSLLLVIESEFK